MNMFKRSVLAPLAVSGALLAMGSPAFAADGVVNFMGSISDVTCDINGQAPGIGNVTHVDLGTVAPGVFTAVGTASPSRTSTWSCPAPAAPMARRLPSPSTP